MGMTTRPGPGGGVGRVSRGPFWAAISMILHVLRFHRYDLLPRISSRERSYILLAWLPAAVVYRRGLADLYHSACFGSNREGSVVSD